MKTAFLFAGQGSQKPGMGRDLYTEFEGFKNCFDKLPAEQRSIAFDGSMEGQFLRPKTRSPFSWLSAWEFTAY